MEMVCACLQSVKYKGWMKTSSNIPPTHIKTCCVQFSRVLVQQHYIKTKSLPICTWFTYIEIPLTQLKCNIEAVYFKKQDFYQWKLNVSWNYSQAIFWFLSCLLGYWLSQHTKFQILPVSIVGWVNVLIPLKMETGSFQKLLCVVSIKKFLMIQSL